MPLFLIQRGLPGATQQDVDAAGYRAVACAFNYQGLRWVSSVWARDEERLYCLYEAESAEQIQDHSRRAAIPCDSVSAVLEVLPTQHRRALTRVVSPSLHRESGMHAELVVRGDVAE